jgi:N-acetylglucosaminyldiphosphoundecaprenol N-acetyl-beta-D-mannosaminyltransferase
MAMTASRSSAAAADPETLRVGILGVAVSTLSMGDTVDRIIGWALRPVEAEGPRYVCATTVHGLMEARRDPSFRRILNRGLITPDGMPLVWLARWRGHHRAERVYGPSLMLEVCRASAMRGIRHFFYGGAPGVAERLGDNLGARFPGLSVAGSYCPPFRPLTPFEVGEAAERINEVNADVVWVGLGTPRQERWINSVRSRLRAKVMLSVGAAFDFHTGRVKQAPPFLQRSGLEWAFRLAQEPRRLWRRYLYNNPVFVLLSLVELIGLKNFPVSDN